MYLHIPTKAGNDCLKLVFRLLLRYFYFIILTLLPLDIFSWKFGTSRYNMIYLFFMTSCLLHILLSGLVTLTVGFGLEMSFAVTKPIITHSQSVRMEKHKISILILAVCHPFRCQEMNSSLIGSLT